MGNCTSESVLLKKDMQTEKDKVFIYLVTSIQYVQGTVYKDHMYILSRLELKMSGVTHK